MFLNNKILAHEITNKLNKFLKNNPYTEEEVIKVIENLDLNQIVKTLNISDCVLLAIINDTPEQTNTITYIEEQPVLQEKFTVRKKQSLEEKQLIMKIQTFLSENKEATAFSDYLIDEMIALYGEKTPTEILSSSSTHMILDTSPRNISDWLAYLADEEYLPNNLKVKELRENIFKDFQFYYQIIKRDNFPYLQIIATDKNGVEKSRVERLITIKNNKVFFENKTETILAELEKAFLEQDQAAINNIVAELDNYLSFQENNLIKATISAIHGGTVIFGKQVQILSTWLTQLNNGISLSRMSNEYFHDFRKKYKFYYKLFITGENLTVRFYAYDKNNNFLSETNIIIVNKNNKITFTNKDKKQTRD